jgi:hypothetical protein
MDFKIRNEETSDIDQVREIMRAAFPTEAESKLVVRCGKMARQSSHWSRPEVVIKCWGTFCSVRFPPPHRAMQKQSGLHPSLSAATFNPVESAQD